MIHKDFVRRITSRDLVNLANVISLNDIGASMYVPFTYFIISPPPPSPLIFPSHFFPQTPSFLNFLLFFFQFLLFSTKPTLKSSIFDSFFLFLSDPRRVGVHWVWLLAFSTFFYIFHTYPHIHNHFFLISYPFCFFLFLKVVLFSIKLTQKFWIHITPPPLISTLTGTHLHQPTHNSRYTELHYTHRITDIKTHTHTLP